MIKVGEFPTYLRKITRRTTGARGCYFLTSFESFLSSNKYQVTSIRQQVWSKKYQITSISMFFAYQL